LRRGKEGEEEEEERKEERRRRNDEHDGDLHPARVTKRRGDFQRTERRRRKNPATTTTTTTIYNIYIYYYYKILKENSFLPKRMRSGRRAFHNLSIIKIITKKNPQQI
jgi:hypothetical protein